MWPLIAAHKDGPDTAYCCRSRTRQQYRCRRPVVSAVGNNSVAAIKPHWWLYVQAATLCFRLAAETTKSASAASGNNSGENNSLSIELTPGVNSIQRIVRVIPADIMRHSCRIYPLGLHSPALILVAAQSAASCRRQDKHFVFAAHWAAQELRDQQLLLAAVKDMRPTSNCWSSSRIWFYSSFI